MPSNFVLKKIFIFQKKKRKNKSGDHPGKVIEIGAKRGIYPAQLPLVKLEGWRPSKF